LDRDEKGVIMFDPTDLEGYRDVHQLLGGLVMLFGTTFLYVLFGVPLLYGLLISWVGLFLAQTIRRVVFRGPQ
jgi:hypothetical protein